MSDKIVSYSGTVILSYDWQKCIAQLLDIEALYPILAKNAWRGIWLWRTVGEQFFSDPVSSSFLWDWSRLSNFLRQDLSINFALKRARG